MTAGDRASVIRKVRACLRLARSSNPNEAAAALRQARAMMAQHGLDEDAIRAAEFTQARAKTRQRGAMVPTSVANLAELIALGFRCQAIVSCDPWLRTTEVVFHGAPSDAELAAYAFVVMRRQMDADRLRHIKRIRKAGNRKRRGEWFARAWVHAVEDLFPPADLPDDYDRSLTASFERAFPVQKTVAARDPAMGAINQTSMRDFAAGLEAGRNARFHRGVGGTTPAQLEHAS